MRINTKPPLSRLFQIVATATLAMAVGSAASASYDTVEDEGSPLPQQNTLNFRGQGIACSNDVDSTLCEVPGTRGIFHAVDFDDGTSVTGGIAEAYAACTQGQSGGGRGRCIIHLPRGIVGTDTIRIGGLVNQESAMGLVIKGHGSGFDTVGGPKCGTVLDFTGASGSSVMELFGARYVRLEDFCIKGNGIAAQGLDVAGDSDTSSIAGRMIIENVGIFDVTGALVRIAGEPIGDNDQIDVVTLRNVMLQDGDKCIDVNSGASIVNEVSKMVCRNYATAGVHMQAGQMDVLGSFFGGPSIGASAVAILVEDEAKWVNIERNEMEIDAGDGIVVTGATRKVNTRIVGNLLALGKQDGYGLSYDNAGALAVIGNLFGVRSGNSNVNYAVTSPSAPIKYIRAGNHFAASTVSETNVIPQSGGRSAFAFASDTGSGISGGVIAGDCLPRDLSANTDCHEATGPGTSLDLLSNGYPFDGEDGIYFDRVTCTAMTSVGWEAGESIRIKIQIDDGSSLTSVFPSLEFTGADMVPGTVRSVSINKYVEIDKGNIQLRWGGPANLDADEEFDFVCTVYGQVF